MPVPEYQSFINSNKRKYMFTSNEDDTNNNNNNNHDQYEFKKQRLNEYEEVNMDLTYLFEPNQSYNSTCNNTVVYMDHNNVIANQNNIQQQIYQPIIENHDYLHHEQYKQQLNKIENNNNNVAAAIAVVGENYSSNKCNISYWNKYSVMDDLCSHRSHFF